MKTLILDTVRWDLVLDIFGDIAVASEPYSMAQDAASAIRTFQGEVWYDTSMGVPFWGEILGQSPPLPLIKAKFVSAAMTVPGVVSAKCFISSITARRVTGQVQVADRDGLISTAAF